MSETPISRFPIPELDEMPDDLRERIEAVQEKAGFIPNVFLALAHRPDEWRAFFAHHDALMDKDEGLSKAERELVVVATSALNQCHYCVIAHGAILRVRSKRPNLADQVAVNYRKAELSQRERFIVEFALQVAERSHSIEQADLDLMQERGFTQDEIWDIAAITAFFAMSNRLASVSGMLPNESFYAMGR